MGQDEATGTSWSSYDQSFREDAHQLLVWGYNDSRHRVTSDLEETEVTGFIVEAIETKLSAPDMDERFDRYSIKEDNPVPGEGRTGKRRRRMDVIVECTYRPRHKQRPRYVFEAKRLRRPSHLIGYYVGEEGVRRFVEGKYAADCPEVAMVGYVQSDTTEYWVGRLEEKFAGDSSGELQITEELIKVDVIPSLTDEWTSQHNRRSGTPIVIYHVFLDCSELSTRG